MSGKRPFSDFGLNQAVVLVATLLCGACNPWRSSVPTAALVGQVDLHTEKLVDLRGFTAGEVAVIDPYEKREVLFRGVDARSVFDQLWGKRWQAADEVLITCLDGYQPVIPVQRFLQRRAWFAFERVGHPSFSIEKEESSGAKQVMLAPAYLVWDSAHDTRIRADSDFAWPYQISGLELVVFSERFSRVLPPNGSTQSVQTGFRNFRAHCLKCHSVNGQGGRVGPELNFPTNATEYLTRVHLRRWIADPVSVRWGTKMPPLRLPKEEQGAVIESVLDYLETMRSKKIAPL